MSFTIPLFQRSTIKSDDGFTVTLVTRDILRYMDKEFVLSIGIDVGAGIVGILNKTVTQIAPQPGEDLSPTQVKRVLTNIADALKWRGWMVDFIS